MPAGALQETALPAEGLDRTPTTTTSVATPSETTAAKRNDRINCGRRYSAARWVTVNARRISGVATGRASGEELDQQLRHAIRCVELHPVARAFDSLVAPRRADVLAGAEHPVLGEVVVTAAPDAESRRGDVRQRRHLLELALRHGVRAV